MHATGYNELVAALQQLQGQLNKNGLASLAGRVSNVQSLLLGPVVARALQIRSAVLQRRRPRTENAILPNAKDLAKEVSSIYPNSDYSYFGRTTTTFYLSSTMFFAVREIAGPIEFTGCH